MSLVTSVCIIGMGPRIKEDVRGFFTEFHKHQEGDWWTVPPNLNEHAIGNKHLELDVYCIAYNYCNVPKLREIFDQFDWLNKPVMVARVQDGDNIEIRYDGQILPIPPHLDPNFFGDNSAQNSENNP